LKFKRQKNERVTGQKKAKMDWFWAKYAGEKPRKLGQNVQIEWNRIGGVTEGVQWSALNE
jgi:hypothetical protein